MFNQLGCVTRHHLSLGLDRFSFVSAELNVDSLSEQVLAMKNELSDSSVGLVFHSFVEFHIGNEN